jgi:hypothetical protein
MNALVTQQMGALSTRFGGLPAQNDLGAGISGGFGHIGYKGKVWSIRHRGETINLMRPDNDGPLNSIEVVIIRAPQNLSKVYYINGYVEGSNAKPDCFSSNGVTPDPTVQANMRQAPTCAQCKWNVFGSKPPRQDGTPSGKGKACADSKRLAVVPLLDIDNERFGGPLLLRVPAGSLQDLAQYGDKMGSYGYPYYAIGTRISFKVDDPFPSFVFKEVRALSDDEADKVLALRDDPRVVRILAENEGEVAVPVQPAGPAFEQAPPGPAPGTVAAQAGQPAGSAKVVAFAPASAPRQAPPPAAAPQPAPTSPKPTGFGGGVAVQAPVQQTAQQPVQQAVQQATQQMAEQPAPAAPTAFEQNFDAQLDALLGE